VLSPTIYFAASLGLCVQTAILFRITHTFFSPCTSHPALQSSPHHQLGYELAELVNFGSVGQNADFQVEDFLLAWLQNRH